MHKKALAFALSALFPALPAHADVDLLGKAVQLYGKLHVSADYYDRGVETATVPNPSGTEITSNASRLGFKGKKELRPGVNGVFKFESEIDLSGEDGALKARNRYLGLNGAWGTIIAGIHDTPLKDVASHYTLFGDTIGDRRSILGQTAEGKNLFNVRAKSMAMYSIEVVGLEARVMYATDFEGKTNPDSDNQLLGAGLSYQIGDFSIAAAYEDQRDVGATTTSPAPGKDASAYRVGAKYKFGPAQIGAVYEKLNDDGLGKVVERTAYGVNAKVKLGDFTVAGQYLKADSSEAASGVDDGADQYSAGVFYALAKEAEIYLMYAALNNDTGASYQLARSGHGQTYAPTRAGEKVTATSLGMIYKF